MVETRDQIRNRLVASLLRIQHTEKDSNEKRDNVTKLSAYFTDGLRAATTDSDLFAHFIAWNSAHGKVRDARVALPVIALRRTEKADADLAENAVSALLMLSPRDLVRSYDFSKYLTKCGEHIHGGHRRMLETGIKRYLQERENHPIWWDRTALQHRDSLKRLYRLSHVKPSGRAQRILFDEKYGKTVFGVVAQLKSMPPKEAAGAILEHAIPFQVAIGAVAKAKDKDVLLALIEGMSGNQLVTNTAMLERLGVMSDSVLRAAYDAGVERAKKDKKTEALKTTRATASVKDERVKAKLAGLQEAKTKQLGSIDGDWLVLGDRSGSMRQSVEVARQVASLIAERVSGKVHLVFFNDSPIAFDATGKTYATILAETRRVIADGSTSIGCGLDYILSRGIAVNGIAIVSDGGENKHPLFPDVYKRYRQVMAFEPPCYLFHVPGEGNALTPTCQQAGIGLETFDLGRNVDHYSLPNLVGTLRANRYAFFQEVLDTPLLTFNTVFKETRYAD
jgi:hypothetical protein